MKQIKFLTAVCTLTGLAFFSSCNSGDDKKTGDATVNADSSAAKKTEPAAPAKPANVLIIRHKVADYAKWKAAYDTHDSARLAFGLHNYVVARGTKDSNTVMVVVKMDDYAKAKDFAAQPSLKTAMQKGGVIGEPKMMFIDMQMMDTSTNAMSTRVIVQHKVKDWDAWKKEFDSHKQARMDAGLTDRALGYEYGNNKMVSVVFIVTDMKKAEAFFGSKDLKEKMAAGGVEGEPDIFFYTVAQKY